MDVRPIDLTPFELVVFDADGTLRRTLVAGQPCPHAPDQWELLPGVRATLRAYDWRRIRFAVASNQDHVGYALLTPAMAKRLLQDMTRAAIGDAASAALIRFCPHRQGEDCACRKPRPGMLIDLCRDAGVEPSRTLFVGDAGTDQLCAANAGTRFMWAESFFRRWR